MTIDFVNETAESVDAEDLRGLADHVMANLGMDATAELSVVCVPPEAIAVLHEEYLDEPGPTDVMSFPMDELRPRRDGQPPVTGMLGDVVLCPAVAARQADAAGHDAGHELRILLAHGILHLLGFDHVEPDDEAAMFALQQSLVAQYEDGREEAG